MKSVIFFLDDNTSLKDNILEQLVNQKMEIQIGKSNRQKYI
jgi:hypothetical protein